MAFFNEWKNTKEFRQPAIYFEKNGYYTPYPEDSYEYDKFWDEQEQYIEEGFTNSVGQYICGLHYFYLNFARIYNKALKKMTFPDFWDTDAWVFEEIEAAVLEGEHLPILKARQKGGSLKGIILAFKRFYFNRNSMNYIGAFIEDKADRAWEMMAHMANHLDRHTAWRKTKNPDKKDFWKAQFKETINGREFWSGYKSELHKLTFKQNPSYGVGGAIDTFVYDECGLAPTLDKTLEYIDPACSDGSIRTGIMIMIGSVGELKDCQAFRKIFYSPENNSCRKFENIWDLNGSGTYCGLFIPEYYSLKGFIDVEGNSKLAEAKAWCEQKRNEKKKKEPEAYRLYISQHPFSPEEAFAQRKESNFPVQLIDNEMHRIEQDADWGTCVELEYNKESKLYPIMNTNRKQVMDFPVRNDTDKRGSIVIYKHPPKDGARWGQYFAGVDPVKNMKSNNSDSLAAVYIYERQYLKGGIPGGDEVVACYVGRQDDHKEHHEQMARLIEYYNAGTLIEVNVTSFMEYMIQTRRTKYLLRKQDVPIIQEWNVNTNTSAPYGIVATTASNVRLIDMIISYLKEGQEKFFDKDTGELTKTVKGVNKIRDFMLLKEMIDYTDDLNVDRIMAFGYALMAARSNSQHFSMEIKENNLDYVEENKRINNQIVNTAFARLNKGAYMKASGLKKVSQPFKNIR